MTVMISAIIPGILLLILGVYYLIYAWQTLWLKRQILPFPVNVSLRIMSLFMRKHLVNRRETELKRPGNIFWFGLLGLLSGLCFLWIAFSFASIALSCLYQLCS